MLAYLVTKEAFFAFLVFFAFFAFSRLFLKLMIRKNYSVQVILLRDQLVNKVSLSEENN